MGNPYGVGSPRIFRPTLIRPAHWSFSMQFSAMTMNMFLPHNDDPDDDRRIIDMTVAQAVWLAELGYNPWFTDHHFKGPANADPMQLAAHIAAQIPSDRYMGF